MVGDLLGYRTDTDIAELGILATFQGSDQSLKPLILFVYYLS